MKKLFAWLTHIKCCLGWYRKTASPLLDIYMITYKSEKFEKKALDTLKETTDVPYRLTVIDNNNSTYCSLTALWNDLAQKSTAPYLCFMNPDVVFAPSWASNLMRAFRVQDVVIASPCTPTMSGSPLQRVKVGYNGSLAKLAARQKHELRDDPYIVGYCYVVNRLWLKDAGFFDEESFPFYGTETDLNFRAFAAGQRAVNVSDSIVLHIGRGCQEGAQKQKLDKDLETCFQRLQARWPNWELQS